MDIDVEPDWDAPTGSVSGAGAGTLGFAGTARSQAVARATGLATLGRDEFGNGSRIPMMPNSWGAQRPDGVESSNRKRPVCRVTPVVVLLAPSRARQGSDQRPFVRRSPTDQSEHVRGPPTHASTMSAAEYSSRSRRLRLSVPPKVVEFGFSLRARPARPSRPSPRRGPSRRHRPPRGCGGPPSAESPDLAAAPPGEGWS